MRQALLWIGLGLLTACGGSGGAEQVTPDIFAAVGEPMPRASKAQQKAFDRGKAVALRRFTPEDGLGPTFNQVSCTGCHERPTTGGSAARYRDFLLVADTLSDGSFVQTGKKGIQNQFSNASPQRVPSDPNTSISATRNPIPFFGTGLLAEISDEEILRRADPDDADGDGIRGRPNYDRGFVGRFGRKAQTVSIEGFIRGPLFNHLGITSDPLSPARKRELPVPSAADGADESQAVWEGIKNGLFPVAHAQLAAPDEPNFDDDGVPDPELSEDDLFDLISFSMLLAPMAPDLEPSDAAMRGHEAFRQLGCDGCHVEDLRGPGGLVPAFSDLLLHDMGEAMADGIRMGEAGGADFRTQPLWGVAATAPYLHDGRADTLDEAIRAHGGEARASRRSYTKASEAQRADVVAFLESLGGREVHSDGLIPPGTPLGKVGSPGGPARSLSSKERERFLRGRAVFDRDFGRSQGLGPEFNGDSCRACHFDPVVGGAGSADVDVTRQAIQQADFPPEEPVHGTMAHRQATNAQRPSLDPASNVFERRQTPTLLGLGLIDAIDEDAILANADPDDADGDGVSGRVRRDLDGKLGRLGWKADVPSLVDFVHDGMSTEMGVTVPPGGSRFGALEDDDGVPDPEVSRDDLDDLTFFLRELAPPQPRGTARERKAGAELFAQVGCADCHVPSLPTTAGDAVPLFSDLLLHDIAGEAYVGIPDGDAMPRELRTPPLWGLGDTAPYLHDGSASDPEQAIAAHASEADAARRAYEALDGGARKQLIAFLNAL